MIGPTFAVRCIAAIVARHRQRPLSGKTGPLSMRPIRVGAALNGRHATFPFRARECCVVAAVSAAFSCTNTAMP